MSDLPPLAATLALRRRLILGDDQAVSDPLGSVTMAAFRLTLDVASMPASMTRCAPRPSISLGDVRAAAREMTANVDASDETVMKLAPPNCGPLELRIAARSGGVSVTMICNSAETRTALLAMLPRLRDALAVQGIPLLFGGIAARAERSQVRDDAHLDDYA
ncbi:MAG: flagellar hook-length control protein FliK [Gammaproteobacteria bacterium]|nr:flagellar hook-length control protein FliK [Gammaproteobacteria bacterium]